MKYKAGDEFIVKIKEVMDSDNGTLYRSNFNTLVFDEYGLDKLQKLEDTDFLEGLKTGLTGLSCKSKEVYEKGLADAWELARKIAQKNQSDREKIFNFGYCTEIFQRLTPQQALAKIEAYEKSHIEIGDVVYANGVQGVVIDIISDDDCYIYDENGCIEVVKFEKINKTGRTVDIEHLLEQIRGDE